MVDLLYSFSSYIDKKHSQNSNVLDFKSCIYSGLDIVLLIILAFLNILSL